MALAGNLGGLAVGYNTGVVAPAMLFMEEIFPEITPIGKAVRIHHLTSSVVIRQLCNSGWNYRRYAF